MPKTKRIRMIKEQGNLRALRAARRRLRLNTRKRQNGNYFTDENSPKDKTSNLERLGILNLEELMANISRKAHNRALQKPT